MASLTLHWYYLGQEDVVALSGPSPDRVAVFVHGYGVKWPSKGLFTDVAASLAQLGVACVLFDLSDYSDSGDASFLPLGEQQDRLRQVLLLVRERYPAADLDIVAHSLGCAVTVTSYKTIAPMVDNVVLLAPAVGSPGSRIYEGMMAKEGAQQDGEGNVSFPRRDGTTSSFSRRYVSEFSLDLDTVYKEQLTSIKNLSIILAEGDDRTNRQLQIFDDNGAVTLPGSDHNFNSSSRVDITTRLASLFN